MSRKQRNAGKRTSPPKPPPARSARPSASPAAPGTVTLTLDGAFQLARQHHEAGRLAEAETIYRRILQAVPEQPSVLHLLGVLHHQTGRGDTAVELIGRALALKPDLGAARSNLGLALRALGRTGEAAASYRSALALNPNSAEAHSNLGQLLMDQGRFDEAMEHFRCALAAQPTLIEAHTNLGLLLGQRGRLDEALAAFQRAIALNPTSAETHCVLGNAFLGWGRLDQAVACYRRALDLKPDHVDAHANLGGALKGQGKIEEAIAALQRAIALNPRHAAAHSNLGIVLKDQGRLEEARACFRRAFEAGGDPGLLLKEATALPIILRSREEIDTVRGRFLDGIAALTARGVRLADPLRQVGQTCFYLAYHARDDLPLQKAIADFYTRACPELLYTAPHCQTPRSQTPQPTADRGRRRRIGFVSAYFYGHTIGLLNRGLIEKLSRERFHVTLFLTPGNTDRLRQSLIDVADDVVWLPTELAAARHRIAEQELDLLYYADIGMSPFTYFLAFARLAPVQCLTWGHPDTTAIPNLDYFLTCDAMEPEGAEHHYTETLVRLPGPTVYYHRPTFDQPPKDRTGFGLPADAHIYLCPQSLFKIHPDYDAVLVDILRRDPAGLLVFIQARDPNLGALLHQRIARTGPDVAGRIRFLPAQPTQDFIALMGACDVMLDPLHYSGGNTSLEAFSMGTPIVTWPGEFMRGRHTHGFYTLMGLDECVARDWDDYVAIALRLGTDPAYRAEVSRRIHAANGVLFENRDTVRAIEDFLAEAVDRACGPEKV